MTIKPLNSILNQYNNHSVQNQNFLNLSIEIQIKEQTLIFQITRHRISSFLLELCVNLYLAMASMINI